MNATPAEMDNVTSSNNETGADKIYKLPAEDVMIRYVLPVIIMIGNLTFAFCYDQYFLGGTCDRSGELSPKFWMSNSDKSK